MRLAIPIIVKNFPKASYQTYGSFQGGTEPHEYSLFEKHTQTRNHTMIVQLQMNGHGT
jgi:hypothetical protein